MKKVIYTHDEAARIIDMFENILSKYDIHIPSPEDDERDPDNMIGLYGSTYSELLDDIEECIIDITMSCKQDSDIVIHEFSGDY